MKRTVHSTKVRSARRTDRRFVELVADGARAFGKVAFAVQGGFVPALAENAGQFRSLIPVTGLVRRLDLWERVLMKRHREFGLC